MRIFKDALEAATIAAWNLLPRQGDQPWEQLSAFEQKNARAIVERAIRVYAETPKRKGGDT